MPAVVTIAYIVPVPANSFGWLRRTRCRVLAGCYETAGPPAREVYCREQIGHIDGIGGEGWEGGRQTTAKLYVRVVAEN